jgi:pimeloyl-ACP methyl ester carboxylesterase
MLGSAGQWSVLIDRLAADPAIGGRFQFLTFTYDSLRSIPESAHELVEALTEARRRFDPEGRDPSFDRIVLVGHSLGGLVAKAVATASPRVGRVVCIATPHRGAPYNRGAVRSVGTWLARAVGSSFVDRRLWGAGGAVPKTTSVDQLAWDNPFLRDLIRAGDSADIPFHSIIAALGDPTAEGATDGVVPVVSARLDNARSEVVIRAHHLCVQHPDAIEEVRRILLEHSASPGRPSRSVPWTLPFASATRVRTP